MPDRTTFDAIVAQLRPLLARYSPPLVVTADTPIGYSLDVPASPSFPQGVFAGGVQVRKNYVSYYLMPVYMFPELLVGLSEPLRKRMQGKSCFNFATLLDASLLAELEQLTERGMARFRQERPR
jgi:hypothetical protein